MRRWLLFIISTFFLTQTNLAETGALRIGLIESQPARAKIGFVDGFLRPPLVTIDLQSRWICLVCEKIPEFEEVTKGKAQQYWTQWQLTGEWHWSDGKPVTGNDIAWTLREEIASADDGYPISEVQTDPKNPLGFRIRFKKPVYDYYRWLAKSIRPAHNLDPNLVYGPYMVKSKSKKLWHLERNPHDRGMRPEFSTVEIHWFKQPSQLFAAYAKGTIQMIPERQMSPQKLIQLIEKNPKSDEHSELVEQADHRFLTLVPNIRNPQFSDKQMRRSLSLAIDRARLASKIHWRPQPTLFPRYRAENVSALKHNISEASKLLSNLGWQTDADGRRFREGHRLRVKILSLDTPARRKIVAELKNSWQKVGIDTRSDWVKKPTTFFRRLSRRDFEDLALVGISVSPQQVPWEFLHSSAIPTEDNPSGKNFSGWRNRTTDRLLSEAFQTTESEKLKALIFEIRDRFWDELPMIPIVSPGSALLHDETIGNVHFGGHRFPSSIYARDWRSVATKRAVF